MAGENMTVGELIAILEKLPRDMRVLVDGYEGGLRDPETPYVTEITTGLGQYFGPYADGKLDGGTILFRALVVPRDSQD